MRNLTFFFFRAPALMVGLGLALLGGTPQAAAQVGIGTAAPDASAVLELSTTNKGLLLPRLTLVQRNAIASPAAGLMIYQTDNTPGLYLYGGSSWSLLPDATQTTGDNLGNHTATQDLSLGTHELTGNGGTTGLRISSGGVVEAASQRLSGLVGNGTRLVQADANGNLTTQDAALSTAVTLAATPLLSSTALATNPRDVAVAGTYAYVLLNNSNNGLLHIYNISTPTAPVLTGSLSLGGAPEAIAVSGTYAYVANNTANTLQIVNVSAPAAPTLAATIGTGSQPAGVAVSGSYAYVTNETSNTLQVFNVAAPAAPVLAATIATQNTGPRGIALKGNYTYVASGGPLEVFNISTPASPVAVGTFGGGTRYGVTVSGQYAYATGLGSSGGLYVYDLSNPAAPVQVGEYDTNQQTWDAAVSGGYAYVATGNNQLLLIDVSIPASPTLVTSLTTTSSWRVAVSGQVAYLANRSSGNTFQAVRFLQPSMVTVGPDGTFSTTASSALADNLGNHTATQSLSLGTFSLTGNGGTTGLTVSATGGVATAGTLTVGTSGTALAAIIKATVARDLPAIGAGSSSVQTFSVTGATTAGTATISPANALNDGLIIQYARVSAAGTVEVKFYNRTAASIDEATMNFLLTVVQ